MGGRLRAGRKYLAIARLEEFQDFFGWPAENRTLAGDGNRPLDEARVLDHGCDELGSGERLVLQAELLVLLLPRAHEIAGIHPEHFEKPAELVCRRGCLQVLENLGLDTVLAEQADRLPGFASAGVVPHSNHHFEVPPSRQSYRRNVEFKEF